MTGDMFREVITSADGTIAEGTCSEAHALALLRTAVRRGYRAEATRHGGAVVERDVWDGGFAPRKHTVTLEPLTPAGALTATVRADLDAIARARAPYFAREGANAGRIIAGFRYGIPPATSARLAGRGLVTIGGSGERPAVSLSLAARLAMLAADHHTSTRKPHGVMYLPDEHRAGHPGSMRRGGYPDFTSTASCVCRWWKPADDRDSARRKARGHRQQVTAEFVTALAGAR